MMSLTKISRLAGLMLQCTEQIKKLLDGDDGFISNSSFLGVAFNTEDDPYDNIGLGQLTLRSLKNRVGGLR